MVQENEACALRKTCGKQLEVNGMGTVHADHDAFFFRNFEPFSDFVAVQAERSAGQGNAPFPAVCAL